MRVSSLFWCIFFAKCLERIIICCIFAVEKLKFNVLKDKAMKKSNINNRKQRYNLFVEESARVLGGYMMTTEEMTRKQLEKFMVKVARQYVKDNCEKGESYKLIAETTEDAGEMLVISVEAWRATWCRSILVNVYDYEAVDFTTWWSEKKAPKTEEETAEEEPAELFAVNGETFSKGDRVTVETVDAYDAHTSTEAGILTGYASGQALAEVTTDDGRRVYAHFGSVKHAPAEVVENESECVTVYRHTTGAKVASIARTIADAVGVCFGSSFPASDMAHDLKRFDRWQRGESTPDIMDASAAFFFAVRKQGSESGRVTYVRERCRVLGAPVYVLKVEREEIAGLYTLRVRVASPATGETVADAWEAKKEDNEGENGASMTAEDSAAPTSAAAEFVADAVASVKRYAKRAGETAAAAFFRLVGALLIALTFVSGIASIIGTGYMMGQIIPDSCPWLVGVVVTFLCSLLSSFSVAFVFIKATQAINKASNYRFLPYNY